MKKLVVLLTLVATVSAFSQGQVNFVTKNSTPGAVVNAPIDYAAGGPVTAATKPWTGLSVADGALTWGPNARAALYAVAGTTTDASTLSIITPAVPFRSTSGAAGYVDPNTSGGTATREVPNCLAGGLATFQIRAWDAGVSGVDTYEAALTHPVRYSGVSTLITLATGGGSVAPTYMTTAAGFSMTYVPEPSIIGLGILGAAAALVVLRRRE